MNWVDRVLASFSWIVVSATSFDMLLSGIRPIPVLLGVSLVIVSVSFYYLRAVSADKILPAEVVLDASGKSVPALSLSRPLRIKLIRFLLILGCAGVLATLAYQRTMPSLRIEFNDVAQFEIFEQGDKSVYTLAGELDGTQVYGRGQRFLLTLINDASVPVDVTSLGLRLISHDIHYPLTLKYSTISMSLPGTRLPVEDIKAPIRWGADDKPGSLKITGQGIIRLAPKGLPDDKHQVRFVVEATVPGLWVYQVEATYDEPRTNDKSSRLLTHKCMILLRDK